jgi:formyl-CoA transferase
VNVAPTSIRLWRGACATLGAPELADDPRFKTQTLRNQHHRELTAAFQERFLEHDSEYWIRAFREARVPVGPIKTVAEVLDDDPHVKAREMGVELEHPTIGTTKALGVPIKLSETPGAVRLPAPTLGQHSVQVLIEIGYSREEIEALRAAGVIYTSGDADGRYVAPGPVAAPS